MDGDKQQKMGKWTVNCSGQRRPCWEADLSKDLQKMSLSSGEEHSSENIECKGLKVGMSLACLWNKDAFVAGVEWVRGSRGGMDSERRWNLEALGRSWAFIPVSGGSSWWISSRGIYTICTCLSKVSLTSVFRTGCRWTRTEKGRPEAI